MILAIINGGKLADRYHSKAPKKLLGFIEEMKTARSRAYQDCYPKIAKYCDQKQIKNKKKVTLKEVLSLC